MPQYVAFLRAINVGGHVVKMDHLKKLFEDMGLSNVKTFIASGNVIFESAVKDTAALERKIATGLEKALGYAVDTFVRTPAEIADIAAHAPFKPADLTAEGAVYIGMFALPVDAKAKKTILSMATKVDGLHVHKREVYWLARKRFMAAEFTPARMEKTLGSRVTFRNVTTIKKLAALCNKP